MLHPLEQVYLNSHSANFVCLPYWTHPLNRKPRLKSENIHHSMPFDTSLAVGLFQPFFISCEESKNWKKILYIFPKMSLPQLDHREEIRRFFGASFVINAQWFPMCLLEEIQDKFRFSWGYVFLIELYGLIHTFNQIAFFLQLLIPHVRFSIAINAEARDKLISETGVFSKVIRIHLWFVHHNHSSTLLPIFVLNRGLKGVVHFKNGLHSPVMKMSYVNGGHF